jgi:hypothetical protein
VKNMHVLVTGRRRCASTFRVSSGSMQSSMTADVSTSSRRLDSDECLSVCRGVVHTPSAPRPVRLLPARERTTPLADLHWALLEP